MGAILKVAAVVFGIIVFIMGIVSTTGFGGVMLSLIAGAVVVFPLYALSEHLDIMAEIRDELRSLRASLASENLQPDKQIPARPAASPPPSSVAGAYKTAGGGWKCRECSQENASTARTCKGCGKYK